MFIGQHLKLRILLTFWLGFFCLFLKISNKCRYVTFNFIIISVLYDICIEYTICINKTTNTKPLWYNIYSVIIRAMYIFEIKPENQSTWNKHTYEMILKYIQKNIVIMQSALKKIQINKMLKIILIWRWNKKQQQQQIVEFFVVLVVHFFLCILNELKNCFYDTLSSI